MTAASLAFPHWMGFRTVGGVGDGIGDAVADADAEGLADGVG
jgi:hypothetical protein